ncbi:MAG TPA: glutathione S-transferase family protein [Polyangiaceae bacterium]|jgi:glutathione S-transferase
MGSITLAVGNKNYSSWSLRAWLALEHTGAPFTEVVIPLDRPDTRERIAQHSPSGRVPALRDGDVHVWDSLAIAEYLAERFPEARLWPDERAARACARAVSAEMHAGFASLRSNMPMNVRARLPGYGRTPGSLRDIDRVRTLWSDCRARFGAGGPYLFGRFSVADAMYAPVVFRFRSYDVSLDAVQRGYVDAMLAHPAMQKWEKAAVAEPWPLEADEYPAIQA